MKEKITITLFCEKQEELISKIALVFTRKKIKINHFSVDLCENTLLYKVKICICDYIDNLYTITSSLKRIIEVFSVYSLDIYEQKTHQIMLLKIPAIHKSQYSNYPITYLFQENEDWICSAKIDNIISKTLQINLKDTTTHLTT